MISITIGLLKTSLRTGISIIFLATIAVLISANDVSAYNSREDAIQILIDQVIKGDPNKDVLMAFGPQNMLVTGDIVAPAIGDSKNFSGAARTIDRDTWFFFINDEINDCFVHPTRFVYIDANHANPTVGDGITIDVQGWWPKINNIHFYRYPEERIDDSPDRVYGSIPIIFKLLRYIVAD